MIKMTLFLLKNKTVSVVVIGEAILKSHDLYLSPPQILMRYREGDIIGYDNDNGYSNKIDNWWTARCLTIVAAFKYDEFVLVWRLLETKINSLDITTIRTCTLLKSWSKNTLYSIYRFIERRMYRSGSMIVSQSK